MAPPRNGENSSPEVVNGWHHKEPRSFYGKTDEDVEEWLKHYERVSKYNRWDTAAQLAYVVLYLFETALTWFENNEARLTTWPIFVEELRKSFGDPISRRKKAEQTLAQRAQVPGETCMAYIQEVLKLCSLVNPTMTDEDKVGHLLKGIAEDVYNFMITKENLTSAADVANHCRTFEALKLRRICPKFGRLTNVPTVASVDSGPSEDVASLVRRIIREELGHHVQAYTTDPPSYSGPLPIACTISALFTSLTFKYQRPDYSCAAQSPAVHFRRMGSTFRPSERHPGDSATSTNPVELSLATHANKSKQPATGNKATKTATGTLLWAISVASVGTSLASVAVASSRPRGSLLLLRPADVMGQPTTIPTATCPPPSPTVASLHHFARAGRRHLAAGP